MNRHPRTYDVAIANSEGRAVRLWSDGNHYRVRGMINSIPKDEVEEWLKLTRFPHRKQQATFKSMWLMFKDREAMILFRMAFQ